MQGGAADLVTAGDQAALLDADQVMPRPDLTAVGVPGQLEVDAVARGRVDLTRLVGEQHARDAGLAAAERALVVGAVAAAEPVGRVVIDAGEIEAGRAAADL